ncbi:MAG: hypothetical protein U0T75_16240 [Chitinophagales bacterium]
MRPNVLELVEKINRLLQPAKFQHLTKLEADLLKDYLRSLYDVLDDPAFGKTAAPLHPPATEEDTVPVNDSKPAEESKQPEELLIEVDAPTAEKLPMIDTHAVEQVTEAASIHPVEEKTIKEAVRSTKGSLNEIIKKPSSSLNEKLKSAGSEVNKKLATRPLKELIDFNKRHALINELFKGDGEAFSQAVELLDKSPDYEVAEGLLMNNLAGTYHWNIDGQTARMFIKLLKQRFGQA